MDFNNQIITSALKLALKNVEDRKGGPFGAVIVKNNKIISEGVNNVTSSNDPTAHAEVVAIRDACKKMETPFLEDCVIYSSCEPCPMCYSAIRWAKIKKIYYCNTREEAKNIGFDDELIYSEIINKKQDMEKIDNKISKAPFELWAIDDKKLKY
jgi:guanine deaminase